MNGRLFFIALLIGVSASGGATAGTTRSYGEWNKTFKSYEFPSYRMDVPPAAQPVREKAREEELNRLMELRKTWEKQYLEDIRSVEPMYSDPERIQELSGLTQEEMGTRLAQKGDLETLKALALLRNPAIQAALADYRSALEKFSQAEDLEETLNQYRTFTNDLEIPFGPMTQSDPTDEKHPYPGVTTLRGEAVEQDVTMASLMALARTRDVMVEIQKAYEEYVFLDQNIRIDRENLNLFRKLRESAQTQYETGNRGYNSVIQAQIQLDRLSTDLKNLDNEEGAVRVNLLKLVDLPSDIPLGPPETQNPLFPDQDRDKLIRMGLERRQELQIARADVRRMEIMIEMSERMTYPPLTTGASYFDNRRVSQVGSGAEMEAFPTRPESGPKFWYGTRSAFIRELKEDLTAKQGEVKDLENSTEEGINTAFSKLEQANRDRELFEKSLLALADQSLEVSTAEYVSDLIDFPELLDAHNRILEFRIGYRKAVRDQNLAYLDLVRIVGRPLAGPETEQ